MCASSADAVQPTCDLKPIKTVGHACHSKLHGTLTIASIIANRGAAQKGCLDSPLIPGRQTFHGKARCDAANVAKLSGLLARRNDAITWGITPVHSGTRGAHVTDVLSCGRHPRHWVHAQCARARAKQPAKRTVVRLFYRRSYQLRLRDLLTMASGNQGQNRPLQSKLAVRSARWIEFQVGQWTARSRYRAMTYNSNG